MINFNCIYNYGDVLKILLFLFIIVENLPVRVLSASLESSEAENMACINASKLSDILARRSFNSKEDNSLFGGIEEDAVSLMIRGLSSLSASDAADSVSASVFSENLRGNVSFK